MAAVHSACKQQEHPDAEELTFYTQRLCLKVVLASLAVPFICRLYTTLAAEGCRS